ncbi:MAG: TonB-dependent receptor [Chitinophagaceae bacterium]
MKKWSLAICYIFFNGLVFAQQVFTGKVIDSDNRSPLAGATVEIANAGTRITDQNGLFSVSNLQGSRFVLVSSIGYKSLRSQIEFSAGITEIKLERHKLFLQPVEIRAIRAGEKSPFTKTNLGKAEIERNNLGQDLPFLLNQTPSVVIHSDAGNGVGYTGIRIRGSDPTRINVTLNGIPYNDAESQGTFFVDLPDVASSVSSIQIQRGVGTSSNGSGAFGASINIGTNEFREKAYAEISNSMGSFNTFKNTLKAGSGLLYDHFTIDARISRVTSNGYIDRASSRLRSLHFSTAYINKKSSIRFNVLSGYEKTYQSWNGILQQELSKSRTSNSAGTERPGEPYSNETDNYKQDHYQLFFNHQFNKGLSFNTAVFLTRGKGYYEQYKAGQAFAAYGLPDIYAGRDTIRETDLIRQLWLDNYFYGNIFSLQYTLNKSIFTLGGSLTRYDGKHYGRVTWAQTGIPRDYTWYNLDAFKTDRNIYSKWQQKFSQYWEVFFDLQFRSVRYHIEGFRDNPALLIKNTYHFLNPKAGIHYSNNNWNGYLSWSVAHKEPNRDDFEAGAASQPKPETLHDFEAGLEKRTPALTYGVTFYYMRYSNQLVLTGKVNDVGAYTRTNIQRSYRKGIELQGMARISPWVNATGNLTLSSNKVLKFMEYVDDYDLGEQKIFAYNKTDISFSPAVTGSAGVHFTPLNNGTISIINKYVGRQYLDNTETRSRSLPAFNVLDLNMSYTIKKQVLKEVTFLVQVNNLFDRMYEPNGYTFSYFSDGKRTTENYVYPMAGINWMAGVNVKL